MTTDQFIEGLTQEEIDSLEVCDGNTLDVLEERDFENLVWFLHFGLCETVYRYETGMVVTLTGKGREAIRKYDESPA